MGKYCVTNCNEVGTRKILFSTKFNSLLITCQKAFSFNGDVGVFKNSIKFFNSNK